MQSKKNNDLFSMIVPVYKQEKTIVQNIKVILEALNALKIPFEIIVVIDGELDQSRKMLEKIKDNHIKVVGYKNNHGKGYAVRFGMSHSKGKIVGFIDSGGDISELGISMMYEYFIWHNADIIVGSKRHYLSKVNYPWFRRILSYIYHKIIKLFFGLNINDTQVGLKIYRRSVLEDVLPRLLVKKFAFDIEILAVSNYLGYKRIYEAPVIIDFAGVTSITSKNFWIISLRTLWDTVAVFYRLNILHYYDDLNKQKWKYDPELNFRINI